MAYIPVLKAGVNRHGLFIARNRCTLKIMGVPLHMKQEKGKNTIFAVVCFGSALLASCLDEHVTAHRNNENGK